MSLNKIMLIGHVGKDPDVRTLEGGTKVATFSFATTDKAYTLTNGTQVPERTEWHNVVIWRGLADVAEKFVHKGDKLFLEGKVRTRSYDDTRNGGKRYITEIFVDNMEMISVKPQQAIVPPPQPVPQPENNQCSNQCPPPLPNDLPF